MQLFLQQKRMASMLRAILVIIFYLYNNGALAQRGREVSKEDNSYGKGGTVTTFSAHDFEIILYQDPNKARRQLEVLDKLPGKEGDHTKADMYFDCKGNKTYLNAFGYNGSGQETHEIEQRFSGNKITGLAWSLQNGTKLSYNYDAASKGYIAGGQFIDWGTYKPDLTICPKSELVMGAHIPAFNYKLTGDAHYTNTEPDNEYQGGKEMTDAYRTSGSSHENYEVEIKKTYDHHGVLRHEVYREYYEDGCEYEEISYYDCHGEPLYEDYTWYDDDGYDYEFEGHYYKDGKLWAGYYYYDGYFSGDEEFYDAAKDDWVYDWSPSMKDPDDYKPDTSDCPDAETYWNPPFYIGPSLIREDNGTDHFNTYGIDFSYTYHLCYRGGLVGDAGVNFGSNLDTKYTKIIGLVGGEYMPVPTATLKNNFDFSIHALAGATYLESKFSSMNYSSSNSNIYLTGDVGLGFDYKLDKNIGLGLRLDYMPVFSKGNTASNFRLGVGVDF